MDQIKIGRFIAEKRKEYNMTQMQFAEKMGVTDTCRHSLQHALRCTWAERNT